MNVPMRSSLWSGTVVASPLSALSLGGFTIDVSVRVASLCPSGGGGNQPAMHWVYRMAQSFQNVGAQQGMDTSA